ncbi:Bax inhibitor-1/YccA family protein [Streptomyces sp. VRA16 Mangrove soil]|uniref:Bax inhibitor-1/YccA family protein n=1 Tax=Streptomyces sp. VRA16 Mangrove soil TaxID=2817434 RepID=UPI001A9E13F7|nr:Bax inhibitor-1/YccA family protein [Streptomyces sp. VRA16 Mangrove soil]MBO1329994.1 Bax inhibitor-1/YccA family protein [Streptomyces sp. VRA16 Mangrove soil]
MKSSNPILSRWGATQSVTRSDAAPRRPVGTGAGAHLGSDHLANPYAPAGETGTGTGTGPQDARTALTLDDVVVRTASTLGAVALAAVLSWLLLPVDEANIGRSYGIAVGAAIIAFALSMFQSFRRTPSPALILGYAAFEGVFLGVFSNATSTYIAPGVVVQAVLGTIAVSAGMLIAYRLRWIRVTRRFAGTVGAAATGFLLLLVADALFSAFGAGDGMGFHSGGLGIAFGLFGIALGACFLALDFKQVEDAIAFGAPREEAWLAAFGLTATLVWIYLEVLQLLSLFNNDN